MTEQRSPWAQPETRVVIESAGTSAYPDGPGQRTGTADHRATQHSAPQPLAHPAPQPLAHPARGYRSGNVSLLPGNVSLSPGGAAVPARPVPPGDAPPPGGPPPGGPAGDDGEDADDPVLRNRRLLRWSGAVAAGIVAVALAVVLGMVMTGRTPGGGIFNRTAKGPSDTRPELARRCPPPSDAPNNKYQEPPPAPGGPRIADDSAGISYKQYGEPWLPLDTAWVDRGDLKVNYEHGQHFVTEPLYDGRRDFHATILSGHVPAAVNDGLVLDLKCVGHQVAADVRVSFYPENNRMESMRDEQTSVGGRSAWVMKFRLHYSSPGLKAKSELVAIALVDVGRPEAAILYVSIPDTHRQFDYVADEIMDSIRPL